MKIKKFIGRIKFYQNRIGSYLSIINTINIILILSNVYDIDIFLVILFMSFVIVFVVYFDNKFVNQEDIDYMFNRSSSFKTLCTKVDDIYEKFKETEKP